MKKPKILIIGTTDNKGGAAKVSWEIGNNLRKDGWWIKHIVGYKYSNSSHVHQLPTPMGRDFSLYARHLRSYILANDQDFGRDKEILNHPWYKKADIVHLHNTHGNYISLKCIKKISQEKKLIWTLHDMWLITSHCTSINNPSSSNHNPLDCSLNSYPPILWNNKKHLWDKKLNFLTNVNITFTVPSTWMLNRCKKSPIKPKNIEYIPNGVNTNVFISTNKQKAKHDLFLPQNKKIALFVSQKGDKNKEKGLEHVNKIAKENKQVIFIIIGGKKNLKKDNKIYVSNIKKQKKLAKYYTASDILLFPSKSETFGLVVIEAILSECSILSFNTGIIDEIVSHKENGYIADHNNINDFKNGFNYLINQSTKEKKEYNRSARKIAKRLFSLKKMSSNYKNLYISYK